MLNKDTKVWLKVNLGEGGADAASISIYQRLAHNHT